MRRHKPEKLGGFRHRKNGSYNVIGTKKDFKSTLTFLRLRDNKLDMFWKDVFEMSRPGLCRRSSTYCCGMTVALTLLIYLHGFMLDSAEPLIYFGPRPESQYPEPMSLAVRGRLPHYLLSVASAGSCIPDAYFALSHCRTIYKSQAFSVSGTIFPVSTQIVLGSKGTCL